MEQLTIKIRPRTIEEVISLGFLIGKTYFFPLWITTLAAMLPFLLLSLLVVWGTHSEAWGIFVLWLGKPYFERPTMLVLSRLIFNEKWQLSDIKSDLTKSLRGHLLLHLTLRRSSGRISRAAVYLLENMTGKELTARLKYVNKKSQLLGVTIGLSFIETAFVVSLILFIFSFFPDDFKNQNIEILLSFQWLNILIYTLIFLSFSVSNVFFAAIGFMDYLNQRIISEGWAIAFDIQAIVNRLVVIILLSIAVFLPNPRVLSPEIISRDLISHAVNLRHFPIYLGQNVSAYLVAVVSSNLDDKHFLKEKVHDPSVTPFEERRSPVKKAHDTPFQKRKGISINMSKFIRVMVIVIITVGVLWIFFLVWQKHGTKQTSISKKNKLSALKIENEYLDDLIVNPAQVARDLLNSGKETAALSVLYRASLQKLATEFAFLPQKGDSDHDCLFLARPLLPQTLFSFLEKLVFHWQNAAYGGKPPAREIIAQCIDEFTRIWA